MLTIRNEQLAALQQVPRQVFVKKMIEHCHKHYPGDCRILGPSATRKVVELGFLRAEAHGFTRRREVCLYVSLMFLLGSYFDEDPLLPWAEEILVDDPGIANPAAQIDTLWDRAVLFLNRISGPGEMLAKRTLAKLARSPFEALVGSDTGDLEADIRAALGGLHPTRFSDLPEATAFSLVATARRSAVEHGLGNREGIIVYAGLMLLLGASFVRDPLYPWARAALLEPPFDDPPAKARQVFAAARAQLHRYLAAD